MSITPAAIAAPATPVLGPVAPAGSGPGVASTGNGDTPAFGQLLRDELDQQGQPGGQDAPADGTTLDLATARPAVGPVVGTVVGTVVGSVTAAVPGLLVSAGTPVTEPATTEPGTDGAATDGSAGGEAPGSAPEPFVPTTPLVVALPPQAAAVTAHPTTPVVDGTIDQAADQATDPDADPTGGSAGDPAVGPTGAVLPTPPATAVALVAPTVGTVLPIEPGAEPAAGPTATSAAAVPAAPADGGVASPVPAGERASTTNDAEPAPAPEPASAAPAPASAATNAPVPTAVPSVAPTAAPAGPTTLGQSLDGLVHDPVTAQIAPEVVRVVSRGDGVHRMVLRLHPADLGEVRVVVTVRDGSVDVALTAGAEARQHLVSGSHELRHLLESLGGTAQVVVREAAAPAGHVATPAAPGDPAGSPGGGAASGDGASAGTDRDARREADRGPGGTGPPGTDRGGTGPSDRREPAGPLTRSLDLTL